MPPLPLLLPQSAQTQRSRALAALLDPSRVLRTGCRNTQADRDAKDRASFCHEMPIFLQYGAAQQQQHSSSSSSRRGGGDNLRVLSQGPLSMLQVLGTKNCVRQTKAAASARCNTTQCDAMQGKARQRAPRSSGAAAAHDFCLFSRATLHQQQQYGQYDGTHCQVLSPPPPHTLHRLQHRLHSRLHPHLLRSQRAMAEKTTPCAASR